MTFVFSQLAGIFQIQLIRNRWPPQKHLSNSIDEELEPNTNTKFGFFPISNVNRAGAESRARLMTGANCEVNLRTQPADIIHGQRLAFDQTDWQVF